jgi:hypothetical protein
MQEGLQKIIAHGTHMHKESVRAAMSVQLETLRSVVNVQLDCIVNTVDTMTSAFVKELEETCQRYMREQTLAAPALAPAVIELQTPAAVELRTPAHIVTTPPAPRKQEYELSDLMFEDMDIESPPPASPEPGAKRTLLFATKTVSWKGADVPRKPTAAPVPASYIDVVSSSDSEVDPDYGNAAAASSSSSSSSSSASSFEEEEEKPKKQSAYRESDSDDDFVADSSEEPKKYGAQEMFRYVAEQNEKDLRKNKANGKRQREKAHRWSPSDHDKERVGTVENLADDDMDEPVSKEDMSNFRAFIKDVRARGFAEVMQSDRWYQRHFGKPMAGIRDNLGRQAIKNKSPELFDRLVEQCISDKWPHPTVEKKRLGAPGPKTCCFCNEKKSCPRILWLMNKFTASQEPETIAVCCSVLAQAVIEFFKYLFALKQENAVSPRDEDYKELQTLFAEVQAAHAAKGEKPSGRGGGGRR